MLYFEALNKETLKNSYQRFEEEGIILVAKNKESRSSSTRLAPEWTPERDPETGELVARGRLWDFIELIGQSRREGYDSSSSFLFPGGHVANVSIRKNRRDAATVSSRVLAMSDEVGRRLFDNAVASKPKSTVSGEIGVSSRIRRRKDIELNPKL